MANGDSPKELLNRADLYLLLDSYKNNVELSTVISEQLRQIAELQTQFNNEEKTSVQKQKEIYNCLLNIVELLKTHSDNIKDSNDRVYNTIVSYEKNLIEFQTEQKGLFGKVGNKINLLYVGFCSLIISLLGIVYLLVEKLHMLADIAKRLGVENLP
jgi:predicted PurR-regulated permease PerM